MVYAYIRVSTDRQTVENQEYEILRFADTKDFRVNEWIKETVSGTKNHKDRKLGEVIERLKKDDIMIVSEISRLGRSLMEVMGILNVLMEKGVQVYSVKEKYELGDNLNSKVLAFAFSLSAEIERQMISQRTKEALARKRAEGKTLGRPRGSYSKHTKLSGKEEQIKELLKHKVSINAIGRILGVHSVTVSSFIKKNKIH